MSPESDKIVSLSREKFLPNKINNYEDKFLNQVAPVAIKLIYDLLISNKDAINHFFVDNKLGLAITYFKLVLTKLINSENILVLQQDLFQEHDIPLELVSSIDGQSVLMKNFFNINYIAIPLIDSSNQETPFEIKDNKQQMLEQTFAKSPHESDLLVIVWNLEFFRKYIWLYFQISEISFFEKGVVLLLHKGTAPIRDIRITQGEVFFRKRVLENIWSRNRAWYYAIDKYSNQIAVQNSYVTGFEHFPVLSKFSIISPFYNVLAYQNLKLEMKKLVNPFERSKIFEQLSDDLIRRYATPTLINWIIDNRSKSNQVVTEAQVVEGYRELIADMLDSDI
jgi:hypothetical protein